MFLCLDVGNTQIHGGVYDKNEKQLCQFRFSSSANSSSDEMGLFLRNVLRENDVDPSQIEHIGFCSVVPKSIYSLKNACLKYFKRKAFVLEAGVKTGLKIKYKNPAEVGADRIANSIAAVDKYPDKNLIIIDFGTATTFCCVSKDKEYLGGVIAPGMKLSVEALETKTAKLPSVEILRPKSVLGTTTVNSIQSGIYYGHLYSIQGLLSQLKQEAFSGEEVMVLGTGGFARLFEKENIFDHLQSDLVLQGVYKSMLKNL
ncbi:MAG: pantothenate kinase [Bdellovibrionaceae bacterium]|nr:pantothenate kinase [Pseudobdellovibrionaceae bacterium]|tara:strand:+ start:53770 stop:54543 length:774 start_codon:yes stop_codon:yes gene_type:complete